MQQRLQSALLALHGLHSGSSSRGGHPSTGKGQGHYSVCSGISSVSGQSPAVSALPVSAVEWHQAAVQAVADLAGQVGKGSSVDYSQCVYV